MLKIFVNAGESLRKEPFLIDRNGARADFLIRNFGFDFKAKIAKNRLGSWFSAPVSQHR